MGTEQSMETFESQSPDHRNTERKLHDAFIQLQSARDILREMGLRVIDGDRAVALEEKLKGPIGEVGVPIVDDRLNGIRASYTERGGLIIWFTNGFEDPNDPMRQEITRRLREKGVPCV